MKKKLVMLSLFCFAIWLFSVVEPASADIIFQLANSSGKTFREIWVGPSSNENWLDRDRFTNSDGSFTRLLSDHYINLTPNMAGRQNVRYWDIKVGTSDGKKHEWHNIDLIEIYQVKIDCSYTAHFSR